MNTDLRMRSLYLSGEWVRICGLLKSTLWSVLDWIWLHTSEVSLVWCSCKRKELFLFDYKKVTRN